MMLDFLGAMMNSARAWLATTEHHERRKLAADWLAPTRRTLVAEDGPARLYRFIGEQPPRSGTPVLLVPSLINRWYVLDLRRGASVAEALLQAGHDVYLIDWGVPTDEDRYLSWDDLIARLARMVRRTRRHAASDQVALLGYCMGATLSAIYAAMEPQQVAALINLAGPIDFAQAGMLQRMTDRRWFDAESMSAAGNLPGELLQGGFWALRPTANAAKWVNFADKEDSKARRAFLALELWASDNVAFPAAAYATYIGELYQANALWRGEHCVAGRRVDLAAITCPLLVIVASRDVICPAAAAEALRTASRSPDSETIVVPGGHVGAVVGSRAARELYPRLSAWLHTRLNQGEQHA